MSIQTWISGRIGNWFNPANWTTGQVPVPGDSAVINTGTASVSQPTPGRGAHSVQFRESQPCGCGTMRI